MRALLAISLALAQAAPSTGTIEGRVLRDDSGAPIGGARVTLARFFRVSNEFAGAEPVTSTETDARGAFAFKNLDAGNYFVQIAADGYIALTDRYLPPAAGQRTSRVAMVPLSAGQSVGDLLFRASAVGRIAGRVVDGAGRPLAGIEVQVFRRGYDENGALFFGVGGAATTGERGEYNVSVLPRGGYLVLARTSADRMMAGGVDRYGASLYPGTSELANAASIAVAPAATTALLDLALGPLQLHAIRGRVIDESGQPPRDVSVWITTTSLMGGDTITGQPAYDASKGTFEARVGPGRYALGATTIVHPELSRPDGIVRLPPATRQALVDVSSRDVGGVVLKLVTPDVSLRCRLRVDGRALSSLPGWEEIRVELKPSRDGTPIGGTRPSPPPPSPLLSDDGTFQLFGAMLGEFRVRITGLAGDAYVKDARFGSSGVLDRPLEISGPTTNVLEILLSPNGGRVGGTVVDARRRPMPNAPVVLVPDERSRLDLFKSVAADQAGRFEFRGVTPGSYKLFAWTALDPFAYFDGAILSAAERDATAIRVAESSRLDVAVTLVPSR